MQEKRDVEPERDKHIIYGKTLSQMIFDRRWLVFLKSIQVDYERAQFYYDVFCYFFHNYRAKPGYVDEGVSVSSLMKQYHMSRGEVRGLMNPLLELDMLTTKKNKNTTMFIKNVDYRLINEVSLYETHWSEIKKACFIQFQERKKQGLPMSSDFWEQDTEDPQPKYTTEQESSR